MYSSLASQQISLHRSFVQLYMAACIHSCSQWTSVTGGGTIPCDSSCEDELVLAAVVLQWQLVLPQEQLSPAAHYCAEVSQDSSLFYNREYVDQQLSCGLHAQLWVQHQCLQDSGIQCTCQTADCDSDLFCVSKDRGQTATNLPSGGHLQAIHHPCTPVQ